MTSLKDYYENAKYELDLTDEEETIECEEIEEQSVLEPEVIYLVEVESQESMNSEYIEEEIEPIKEEPKKRIFNAKPLKTNTVKPNLQKIQKIKVENQSMNLVKSKSMNIAPQRVIRTLPQRTTRSFVNQRTNKK